MQYKTELKEKFTVLTILENSLSSNLVPELTQIACPASTLVLSGLLIDDQADMIKLASNSVFSMKVLQCPAPSPSLFDIFTPSLMP